MSDVGSNSSSDNSASKTATSPMTPPACGRGRGRGIDNSPLRKPESPRNASRPGSTSLPHQQQSPKRSNNPIGSQNLSAPSIEHVNDAFIPKATVSDSSVGTSVKTMLDVKAREFVPTTTKSAKSLPALSVHAKEFVPLQPLQPPPPQHNDNEILINFLNLILNDLSSNPSAYERSIDNITSFLGVTLSNADSMTIACDAIFHWAVSQANFSYICARLCEHVSHHVLNDHNGRFHQHMLKRCHGEYKHIEEIMLNDPTHASSFAVFLAELYCQNGFRVDPVMNAVLTTIELMVKNLDNHFARPVGQILKMCGASLEDDLAKGNKQQRMEALLSEIRAKVSQNAEETQLSNSMSGLLKSVLTLQAGNWGRNVSPQASVPSSPAVTNFSQEPVFYDTTGQRISREQAGYAVENPETYDEDELVAVSSYNLQMLSIPDEVSGARGDFSESEEQTVNGDVDDLDLDILVFDDEEMTEDMWAEYEKFEAEREWNLRNFDAEENQ